MERRNNKFPRLLLLVYTHRTSNKLKVGQFGNMMFGFPGHCTGLLLFFALPEAAKDTRGWLERLVKGHSWPKLWRNLHRIELTTVFVHIMMQWSICLPIYNATLLTLWWQKHLKLKMKILKIHNSLPNACCHFLVNISISYSPKCSHSHSRLCQQCYYEKLSAARTYLYLHVTSYQRKQTNI